MATIYVTNNHVIDSFGNGLYYVITDVKRDRSVVLQDNDATAFETYLTNVDNVAMDITHRDTLIDNVCGQYSEVME